MPYTAQKPPTAESAEALRARIPGWGSDLDPADRPAFPREQPGIDTGAHWTEPAQQSPPPRGRERSIEHERLTPVFGTAQPLHGLAGRIRRVAYTRFSEGQTAHWLLLVVGDRVDSATAHLVSFFSGRPDNPITQSGVMGEIGRRPVASRRARGRVDLAHTWIDPIIVVGPWILAIAATARIGRRLLRSRRRA